jgi:hypothetical protein
MSGPLRVLCKFDLPARQQYRGRRYFRARVNRSRSQVNALCRIWSRLEEPFALSVRYWPGLGLLEVPAPGELM